MQQAAASESRPAKQEVRSAAKTQLVNGIEIVTNTRELCPLDQWLAQGLAFFTPDAHPILRDVASEMRTFAATEHLSDCAAQRAHLPPGAPGHQIEVIGKPVQTVLEGMDAETVRSLQARFREFVKDKYQRLLIDSGRVPPKDLSFLRFKSLISRQHNGEQMLHLDSEQHGENSFAATAILFCTPTKHTRLPRYHAPSTLQLLVSDGSEGGDSDEARAQRGAHRWILENQDLYFSEQVEAGTLLIFQHSCWHAGVNNESVEPRVLLIDIIGDGENMPDSNAQYFDVHFYRDNFGAKSDVFADALIANKKHDAALRFTKRENISNMAQLRRREEELRRAEKQAKTQPARKRKAPASNAGVAPRRVKAKPTPPNRSGR